MNGHGSAKKHHGPVADRAKLGHPGASRRGRALYTKIRATECRVLAIVESHQLLLVTGSEAHVLKFQQRAGANFHAEDNDSHREHSWRTTIFLTILIECRHLIYKDGRGNASNRDIHKKARSGLVI